MAVWAAALLQAVGDGFPVAPLGPVTVAVLVWVVAASRHHAGRPDPGRGGGVPSTPSRAAKMAP